MTLSRSSKWLPSSLRSLGAGLCMMAFMGNAQAYMPADDFFSHTAKVPDGELDTVRGKFIRTGSLEVTFGLTIGTYIDGVVLQERQIASNELNGLTAQDLIQVTQVGANNSITPAADLQNVPGLISVIQNSLDNKLIQQFNLLDIEVANFKGFKEQSLVPVVNLEAIRSLQ